MSLSTKYLQVPLRADYITKGTKRRSGKLMPRVGFIVAHDTGNPGSTARNNVDFYKRTARDASQSAHLFVDDKEAIECVPALTGKPEKAWHVHYGRTLDNKLYGDDANDIAIGIERCWGGKVDDTKSYYNFVDLIAECCHRFGLDPSKAIISHQKLDPGRRSDPVMSFKQDDTAISTSMDKLISDVIERMGGDDVIEATITVFGKKMDGFVRDGRTYGIVKEIAKAMDPDAVVKWDADAKHVDVERQGESK